jgi:hypothetical protein
VRHDRAFLLADGSDPVCQVRAVRWLMPAMAAAASWVFPSMIFCLNNLT